MLWSRILRAFWSLLSWERGLKLKEEYYIRTKEDVAPLVGAWIEITSCWHRKPCKESLLSWERGLKLYPEGRCPTLLWCRSSRGSVDWNDIVIKVASCHLRRSSRGSVDWNLIQNEYDADEVVAPLVGAWIEMRSGLPARSTHRRSSRGSVDWNIPMKKTKGAVVCRSSRGSVDWNSNGRNVVANNQRRSSRGSVDWNYNWCMGGSIVWKSLLSWERGLKSVTK